MREVQVCKNTASTIVLISEIGVAISDIANCQEASIHGVLGVGVAADEAGAVEKIEGM